MNQDGHPAWRFISVKLIVRRLTCPSHASTKYPIRQILPSLPSPNELPVVITRAPGPRHIPGIPNISQAITARLRRTSPHSFSTEIPGYCRIFVIQHSSQRDDGRFSDMSTLVSNQRGVWRRGHSPPLGLTAGVFLCRRAVRRHRAEDNSARQGLGTSSTKASWMNIR
ncbi:hypothetical protein EDB86DRAFT_2835397 [Lactarius hatsudake]|nr:hypothetical protein EDB86DRAFT_2835397 [Lactarius hatsudake]